MMPRGKCLVPEGMITNTGCRREIASHWCDQPHCEGCYGSLWMEWLRTNGVCFPVAGMVKRALIECTEKGLSLKQWEDCALFFVCVCVSEAERMYSKIYAHCADRSFTAPLRQPSLHPGARSRSVLSISAISVQHGAPVGSALRRDAFAESRRSPWIREIVCVPVLCRMLHCAGLRWTPHCNKCSLTAGTGWNATTTPDPLPPIRGELCIRGHYVTQLFIFWLLWHTGIAWSGLSGSNFFFFSPIFLVSPAGVSVSPLLLTKPFSFTPVHFSNWRMDTASVSVNHGRMKKVIFL